MHRWWILEDDIFTLDGVSLLHHHFGGFSAHIIPASPASSRATERSFSMVVIKRSFGLG